MTTTEADRMRAMPCLCRDISDALWCGRARPVYGEFRPGQTLCNYSEPVVAAHVTARGMGGAKGGRFDLVPLCDGHHREAGEAGTSQRAAFEQRYGLDLRRLADDIALGMPEPLGIRGLARRFVDENRCANCGEPWSTAEQHLTGQMYDGEWVCSTWCEDVHEEEGCPHESPLRNGAAEQAARYTRRTGCENPTSPERLDSYERDALLGWVDRRAERVWSEQPEAVGEGAVLAVLVAELDLTVEAAGELLDAATEGQP